jgi:hypothetical protein
MPSYYFLEKVFHWTNIREAKIIPRIFSISFWTFPPRLYWNFHPKSLPYTEYKLNTVPCILSISLTSFSRYSVCAEKLYLLNNYFFSYKTLIFKYIEYKTVQYSKSEQTKVSRLCSFVTFTVFLSSSLCFTQKVKVD